MWPRTQGVRNRPPGTASRVECDDGLDPIGGVRVQVRTTSTQRTYRYVRLSIVGVIVFLGLGVTIQIVTGGALVSVSAAFYTPARDVFVGSLCAVSLALLALSGRSIEQVLLDLAALAAPVIALVPTVVEPGDVAGTTIECPTEAACVPAELLPGIENSVLSLLILGGLGIVAGFVLARVQGTLTRGVLISLGVVAVIVASAAVWWIVSPSSFVRGAHYVAAIVFFALIGAVAILAAVRPAPLGLSGRRVQAAYTLIAVGMVASLLVLVVVGAGHLVGVDIDELTPVPLVFLSDAAALALFAAFWIVQTIEFWNVTDPRALVGRV